MQIVDARLQSLFALRCGLIVIGRDLLQFGHLFVVGARGHAGAGKETTSPKDEDVVSHGFLSSACVPVAPTERFLRSQSSVNLVRIVGHEQYRQRFAPTFPMETLGPKMMAQCEASALGEFGSGA